jgi:hypothetical protein
MKKVVVAASLAIACAAQAEQGPSSSATPYLVPAGPGVSFTSILTVGDSVGKKHKGNESYRMVGIPDGLGAFDNGDGTITVLMNHELGSTSGVTRDHGGKGAFVSRWQVRKRDLKVLNGEDQIQKAKLWQPATLSYIDSADAAFNRFCSADLPSRTAFYNPKTGLGFAGGRLFMNGEESSGGRAFAHVVSGREQGTSYELPVFGRAAFENLLANPYPQDKTVVIATDDTTPPAGGVVKVYVGTKRDSGNPVELAGLAGGNLYVVAVNGTALEPRATGIASGTPFSLVAEGSPAATKFLRPEDGAWDTVDPKRFYFVTTDRYDQVKDGVGAQVGRSRLWRLNFQSIEHPEWGGTLDMLLDGTEAGQMFDNIVVDASGNLVLLEDVGNQQHNGKIWKYDVRSDSLTLLGKHDPARFGDVGIPAGSGFNQDEESSGVIEVTRLLRREDDEREEEGGHDGRHGEQDAFRYFLLVVQAHVSANDPELVEKGQLLLMQVAK